MLRVKLMMIAPMKLLKPPSIARHPSFASGRSPLHLCQFETKIVRSSSLGDVSIPSSKGRKILLSISRVYLIVYTLLSVQAPLFPPSCGNQNDFSASSEVQIYQYPPVENYHSPQRLSITRFTPS